MDLPPITLPDPPPKTEAHGISLPADVWRAVDRIVKLRGYTSRSQAVAACIKVVAATLPTEAP